MKTIPNWALPLLLIVALGLAVAIGAVAVMAFKPPLQTGAVEIHNIFVDVNGDALPDLIVSGEVIINHGPLALPTPTAAAK